MPEEDALANWQWIYWGIIVLSPMVIGVSLAGIFNRHIAAKKREEEVLRQDAERFYDVP
jgi:hypothetical protein